MRKTSEKSSANDFIIKNFPFRTRHTEALMEELEEEQYAYFVYLYQQTFMIISHA